PFLAYLHHASWPLIRAPGMKHHGLRSSCPIHFALEVVGDSWSLLIVRDLLFARGATYTELLRTRESISTNILANRLGRLEERGIVSRREDGRYELTPKGRDLVPILREMILWSAKHDPDGEHDKAPELKKRARAQQRGKKHG